MPEEFESPEDAENLNLPPSFFPFGEPNLDRDRGDQGALVEVRLEGLYRSLSNGQQSPVVVLSDSDRKMEIVIGPSEAHAIVSITEGPRPDRPMTHDLLKSIIDRLEGEVLRIHIDDVWNGVYYAKVFLMHNGVEIEIDSRPSDAIALAIRYDASIYVAENLLVEVGP